MQKECLFLLYRKVFDVIDLLTETRHAKSALRVILVKIFIFLFSECISFEGIPGEAGLLG